MGEFWAFFRLFLPNGKSCVPPGLGSAKIVVHSEHHHYNIQTTIQLHAITNLRVRLA